LNFSQEGAITMAIAKVLVSGIALGLSFAVLGFVLTATFERSVGASAPLVILNIGCAGAILGSIAGATQAIVEAIQKKNSN
jgi:hypothetical protein